MAARENELVTLNPDREKVLKALEREVEYAKNLDQDWIDCVEVSLLKGALELLKTQEPIKPYLDFDGLDVMRCGACNTSLIHITYTDSDEDMRNYVKYCKHCGRAVKWDD